LIFASIINGCRCRFASIRVACIPIKILDSSTGCGPRQSHIHHQSRIPSIHRKTRMSPSENQIRKIQGESEAPPSFTLQGRADCPRACINHTHRSIRSDVENTRTASQGLSCNDCWESKNRKTSCNRRRRAVVDDNYCHHHRLVAQEDCACERTTPSPLRGDSCKLLKATPPEYQRLEFGATFQSWARALAASESAFFCALAEDSEGAGDRCTMGLR